MLGWLWGKGRKQRGSGTASEVTQKCLGSCGRTLPQSQFVFINHCYHSESDFMHRQCSGFRFLCTPCHTALPDPIEYYRARLAVMAIKSPDQYPWEDCMKGVGLYLEGLAEMESKGIDPSDQDALDIHWVSKFNGGEKRQQQRLTGARTRLVS